MLLRPPRARPSIIAGPTAEAEAKPSARSRRGNLSPRLLGALALHLGSLRGGSLSCRSAARGGLGTSPS